MKQWRVGTVSMGVALILLGTVLFVSQMKGKDAFDVLIDWWPIVFILLGVELLLYIAVSKMSQPIVKYDIFSVLFVGFICLMSIGFTVLTSTGLLEELRYEVNSEERSEELQDIVKPVPATVNQVVVQNNNPFQVRIDYTSEASLHVFGSYIYTVHKEEERERMSENLVSVHTIGDTMYVRVERPTRHNGISGRYSYTDVNIVIPEHVQTKIEGPYRNL